MQALYKFQQQNSRLPNPRCSKDADAMVQSAKEINETLESKVSVFFWFLFKGNAVNINDVYLLMPNDNGDIPLSNLENRQYLFDFSLVSFLSK